ncbi:hypothetical protein PsYK624_077850 [Phanerochaete sordida]|uniref:Uncharacterized protein n=1 Tax=Phanerochaete sordida TaxID=48140 RepID=A0A9P3GD39_9APHY|nr:hypothetical protein PsYK624_077850 [Phanerochaete sordida]
MSNLGPSATSLSPSLPSPDGPAERLPGRDAVASSLTRVAPRFLCRTEPRAVQHRQEVFREVVGGLKWGEDDGRRVGVVEELPGTST